MAQIDELIAAMMARHADALILKSDQPAQLNFNGTLADGDVVPASLLRAMLHEIIPDTQLHQLHVQGEWDLSYACKSGLMDLTVERQGAQMKVIITPHNPSRIFTPPNTPAPTFQTYKPPVDSSFAPPPSYNAAPIPGYSVPMVTSQNAPTARHANAPVATGKSEVDGWLLMWELIAFCALVAVFLPFSILPPALLFFINQSFAWPLLAAIIAAFAILFDARVLGVRRGLAQGWADMDAQGWFFATIALGILGIPLYLAARPAYKRALQKHLLKL